MCSRLAARPKWSSSARTVNWESAREEIMLFEALLPLSHLRSPTDILKIISGHLNNNIVQSLEPQ